MYVVRLNDIHALANRDSSAIQSETENLPWAAAGSNVTLYLTAVDPVHLNIGSVLCPTNGVIPLATTFTARIIVFDIQVPITAGASVSLHYDVLKTYQIEKCAG